MEAAQESTPVLKARHSADLSKRPLMYILPMVSVLDLGNRANQKRSSYIVKSKDALRQGQAGGPRRLEESTR